MTTSLFYFKNVVDFFIQQIYTNPVGIGEYIGGTNENINKRKICVTFDAGFGHE